MTDPFPPGFFARLDESPDPRFYEPVRKVVHIDDAAIAAVSKLYAELVPAVAAVLDLMSSWRSHVPSGLRARVAGLGMNAEEMADNPDLDGFVVHDLNADPRLPYDDATFDAVLCCVSVQYLTKPVEVFADVARVLRPNAPFIVTFSNRCFPPKAIRAWLHAGDEEHIRLVEEYFRRSQAYGPPSAEDRSREGADPLYAVWSRRSP